ncbi:hypothetical protein VBD025_08615 [Virgibacillus flavescens]|uniref:hypothetical protein n=1 Tax=Virgibacillus flavescens TaxID=1611422 RepID=UPI003D329150
MTLQPVMNEREIATEDDQIKMRQLVVEMVRAAHRQSIIQIDSEKDRDKLLNYLSGKKWASVKVFYYYKRLKGFHNNMLNKNSLEVNEIIRMEKEFAVDEPLEQKDEVKETLKKNLNPRK